MASPLMYKVVYGVGISPGTEAVIHIFRRGLRVSKFGHSSEALWDHGHCCILCSEHCWSSQQRGEMTENLTVVLKTGIRSLLFAHVSLAKAGQMAPACYLSGGEVSASAREG